MAGKSWKKESDGSRCRKTMKLTIQTIIISFLFFMVVIIGVIVMGSKISANERAHQEQIMKRQTIPVTATVLDHE